MCFETVGRVVDLPAEAPGTAIVDVGGVARPISLVLLAVSGEPIAVGDWLLTHTGLAVEKLAADQAEALVEERLAMQAALMDGTP